MLGGKKLCFKKVSGGIWGEGFFVLVFGSSEGVWTVRWGRGFYAGFEEASESREASK